MSRRANTSRFSPSIRTLHLLTSTVHMMMSPIVKINSRPCLYDLSPGVNAIISVIRDGFVSIME